MRRTKLTLSLATMGLLLMRSHESARAATASANLSVSATISNNCTITTLAVGFPAYDPIVTHASVPDDSTSGSVTVTCTKGTAATIGLGLGANPSGTQLRMLNGSANYLPYGLYQDTARSTVWGNAGSALFSAGAAPSKAPRTFRFTGAFPLPRTCQPEPTPTPSSPP
jgi:spore coat protein U-like protein